MIARVPCKDTTNTTGVPECPAESEFRVLMLYQGMRNTAALVTGWSHKQMFRAPLVSMILHNNPKASLYIRELLYFSRIPPHCQCWTRSQVMVIFELLWLMHNAVRACAEVAPIMQIRLSPLNTDRAFVADALFRAAFEMGNTSTPVMGVDPARDSTTKTKLKNLLMLGIFTGKIVITTQIIVQILKYTIPIKPFTWIEPWVATIASIFWDIIVCYVILCNAKIRMIGVTTAPEVFTELLGEDIQLISKEGRLQIARAVGFGIVVHGTMFSNMELLLRHAIQYLGLKGALQHAVSSSLFLEFSARSCLNSALNC